jgi:hypothetical protein
LTLADLPSQYPAASASPQMLEALPAGLVAFPGSGISANLADKAKKLGIPVWRHGAEGAA